jgi:hypothetical protein
MSLARLFILADGLLSPCLSNNRFRVQGSIIPSILIPVRPPNTFPVLPALHALPPDECLRGKPTRIDHVEQILLKSVVTILACVIIGCGLGVQRIEYIRQKAELGRQLHQNELEIQALTQACRSLESAAASKPPNDLGRIPACPVAAGRSAQKKTTRG